LVAGLLVAIAGFPLANAIAPERPVVLGTCPSVLTSDGIGASVLAGALYAWAERVDVAPLELPVTEGEYRLRLANDGEATTDFVKDVSLLLVEHDEGTAVLATPAGRLVAVRDAVAPATRTEDRIEFDAVPSTHALLVLTARSTPFAERAFFHYLATMGRFISPIMEHAVRTDCGTACAREVMDDELDRMGLPLRVTVENGGQRAIAPVSPGIPRRFAVPIDVPANERIVIRLEATPKFWEVDSVFLAIDDGVDVSARTIMPAADARGELHFPAPPDSLRKRSAFVSVRGYYRVPTGGALLHPLTILEHRWGITSLPSFAAELPDP
jgi:hypothetical protein